jgi:uncharacterized protein (UPF0335 family)
MATLAEQLKKSKKLKSETVKDDLFKFIRSIEKDILDIEKNRLFNESKDIFGNALGYFSKATEVLSKGAKKAGEPFTAKDTGDFFKGFYMQEVSGVLRFGSTDPKTSTILKSENWLSHELFGLSDKELKDVIETRLRPFLLENAKNKLDL